MIVLLILIFLVLYAEITCDKSQDECYTQRKRNGLIPSRGRCSGLAGGDITTDYLAHSCVGCKYFSYDYTQHQDGERNA